MATIIETTTAITACVRQVPTARQQRESSTRLNAGYTTSQQPHNLLSTRQCDTGNRFTAHHRQNFHILLHFSRGGTNKREWREDDFQRGKLLFEL